MMIDPQPKKTPGPLSIVEILRAAVADEHTDPALKARAQRLLEIHEKRKTPEE